MKLHQFGCDMIFLMKLHRFDTILIDNLLINAILDIDLIKANINYGLKYI